METNIIIKTERHDLPTQTFNGKVYRLYPNERYFNRGCKRLHVEVWKYFKGNISKGYHVHHIDGNTHNNEISNLALINGKLHLRFEGKRRFKENPEFANEFNRKGREASKEWHGSKEGIEWHKKQGAETWINREYKTKTCQVCGKEYKTRHSGESKYCHQNCKAKALRQRRKQS